MPSSDEPGAPSACKHVPSKLDLLGGARRHQGRGVNTVLLPS